MSQADPMISKRRSYYFSRAKDTHTEENQVFITLFARLTCEDADCLISNWAEIEEVKWTHAHKRLKAMPNGIHTYQITYETYQELTELASFCYSEMYYLVPAHQAAKFCPVRSQKRN